MCYIDDVQHSCAKEQSNFAKYLQLRQLFINVHILSTFSESDQTAKADIMESPDELKVVSLISASCFYVIK